MNFKTLIVILLFVGFFVLFTSASNSNLESSNDYTVRDLANQYVSEVMPKITNMITQLESRNLNGAQGNLNSLMSITTNYRNKINGITVSQDILPLKSALITFLDDVTQVCSVYNLVIAEYNIGNYNKGLQILSSASPALSKLNSDSVLVDSLLSSTSSTYTYPSLTSPTKTKTPIKTKTPTITNTMKIKATIISSNPGTVTQNYNVGTSLIGVSYTRDSTPIKINYDGIQKYRWNYKIKLIDYSGLGFSLLQRSRKYITGAGNVYTSFGLEPMETFKQNIEPNGEYLDSDWVQENIDKIDSFGGGSAVLTYYGQDKYGTSFQIPVSINLQAP